MARVRMVKQYSLIYADPPWTFKTYNNSIESQSKSPSRHYDTLSIEEISLFPVSKWTHKDALLAMWVYDPLIPEALSVAQDWGFKYVTVLFRWLKTQDDQTDLFNEPPKLKFGTGYHTRGGGCEEVFLFKKGKGLPVLNHNTRKEFYSKRREHSRKPDAIRQWLVDLYGDVPRLEIFARTQTEGWDVFGNETNKFNSCP